MSKPLSEKQFKELFPKAEVYHVIGDIDDPEFIVFFNPENSKYYAKGYFVSTHFDIMSYLELEDIKSKDDVEKWIDAKYERYELTRKD